MDIKGKISSLVLDRAMNCISGGPEANIPKLLDWMDALNIEGVKPRSKVLREGLSAPGNNWYQLIMSLWRDADNDVLKSVFQNFTRKGGVLAYPKQEALSERYGGNIPMTTLIDPTSACNLKCTGCWAAEYGFNADTTAVRISPHRQSFDLAMGVDRADIGKGGTFRLLVWMFDTSDKGGVG